MKSSIGLVSWSLTIILLGSCAPAPVASEVTEEATLAEVSTQSATQSAMETLQFSADKETSGPQLTKEECLAAGGEIEQFDLESEYLEFGLRFRVYTPPCYAESRQDYPVLYLLHGQSFTEDQWDRLGADEAADELIAAGEIAPFLIVMPFDLNNHRQPVRNHLDEALLNELLPWIDKNYRTLPERESRAIGGLSWGASWAIHFGLTHPELFGAFGGHSPPVFFEDAPFVRRWLDGIPAELMPRIWLDIGEGDQSAILESAKSFEGLLNERDIPHEWWLFSGGHTEEYWSSHVEMYLRWYAAEW